MSEIFENFSFLNLFGEKVRGKKKGKNYQLNCLCYIFFVENF